MVLIALKIFCQISQNLQIQFIRLSTCQWSWSCGAVRVNGSPTLVNGHAGHVNGCAVRISGHVIRGSGRATLVDVRAIRVELIVTQDLFIGTCFSTFIDTCCTFVGFDHSDPDMHGGTEACF